MTDQENREQVIERARAYYGKMPGVYRPTFGTELPISTVMADFALQETTELRAEVERLRKYLNAVNSLSWEEWHGHWQDRRFWIFDVEGEGIASGETVIEALEAFERLGEEGKGDE